MCFEFSGCDNQTVDIQSELLANVSETASAKFCVFEFNRTYVAGEGNIEVNLSTAVQSIDVSSFKKIPEKGVFKVMYCYS